MATIQLGRTQTANRLISYAEKRAEVAEGVDCPVEYAKAQMKATREIWGKTDGVQAHHVIQSFKPGEVTPELANKIGQDLAKQIAKGHEAVVYTHTDKAHIHNHIVINSVNYEDGSKYQAHGTEAIERIRDTSDRLCKEHDLSVVKEHSAQQRYVRAEYGLAKRGQISWKDEIREVIDFERKNSANYGEFKKNLTDKYNIEVKERGKNISFKHPDSQKFVRGKTLGLAYERGTLESGFNRQVERESGASIQERGIINQSDVEKRGERKRTAGNIETNKGSQRFDEKLHQNKHGQVSSGEIDLRYRDQQYKDNRQTSDRSDAFNIDEARKFLEQRRTNVARGFERFTQGVEGEQQPDSAKNGWNRKSPQPTNERNEITYENGNREHDKERKRKLERSRAEDFEHDR